MAAGTKRVVFQASEQKYDQQKFADLKRKQVGKFRFFTCFGVTLLHNVWVEYDENI